MINLDRVIKDTQQLIRIDSQNPGVQEALATEWVGNRLSEMGLRIADGTRVGADSSVSWSASS